MSTRGDKALERVAHYRRELDAATKAQAAATRRLHEWITKAVDAGVTSADVARVAKVSKGRVSQIAPRAEAVPARSQAGKNVVPDSCVTDSGTVPALPDTAAPVLSGVVSVRRRTRYGRETMFTPAAPVADVLAGALDAGAGRVFLTGPAPADRSGGATAAEAVRAWALAAPPAGWVSASHYLADADLPVLRFEHESGHKVTIMRAAAWWGETDATPATCRAAWAGLERALDAVPAFAGAGLADTPSTTGRALWLRTIPEGKGYPVLSDELRGLLHSTAGQGRVELRQVPDELDGAPRDFTVMDGRFMYAALTWGMPVGEPRRWTGAELDGLDARAFMATIRGRGRWRIRVTVPDGWQHVGVFMAPAAGGGWCYPSKPGQVFETWADGCEVWAGMEHGWEPTIVEGITWAEGKPLDAWRDALVKVWQAANASAAGGNEAAGLAARAVRSVLLYSLGAFAARSHPVTRSAPVDGPTPDVPAGADVRVVGDSYVWQETAPVSAWSLETAHPEWSATVWARARTRLLTGRGVGQERVGALHLEPGRVVAFATDALYLAGGAPAWSDDGAPGRFRVKGTRPGAFAWPSSMTELHKLRDEAGER